ncbi:Karyopherin [Hyphodiscus hymeniophilus]|uniref:Karyopherin n=1 Tax=Hyphodiscus hymeniophilus TaxID=353542 RepID=A0A9P6VHS9_9HELO|nr:Karyopherin [Hyphodiscus hymeniophilus]
MATLENGQLPTSLEEVEALVIQLYLPGAPDKVVKTQETLQKLQRSPQGWQLANSLLENKVESVRFFGALTYIVKLNTDSKSLGDQDAQALLQNLIGWLIRCLQNGEGALVLRKLCSTLVAYFLQFSMSWTRCVRHLLYCLNQNEAMPYQSLSGAPDTPVLIDSLSHDKAVVLFWFAATLVDEVGKTDSNAIKQLSGTVVNFLLFLLTFVRHKFHRRVIPNVTDIVPLVEKYISSDSISQLNVKARQEAMRCFQACVSYSHRAFIDDEIVLDPLRNLMKSAIMCLVDENLYEIAVELVSDTLGNYSRFLHKEDFTLLHSLFNSTWAQERYQRLIGGDFDFDSLQFGQFMIAFGDATVQDLAQKVDEDPHCRQFLSALVGLLAAEGHIVNEDKIFVPALEFWQTFLETMIDETYSAEGNKNPSWFPTATTYLMEAAHKCWRKMQFPPTSEFKSWDSVDRTGFKDARRDVSDLIENLYIITGIPILSVFIDLTQQSLSSGNWVELEASLDCLANFPDCISEHSERDAYLNRVFSPALFDLFSAPNTEIPTRAMQAFLHLVNGYADYFATQTKYLPRALNVAFSAVSSPALVQTASEMIVQLCGDCRTILIPELGAFLQQYRNMADSSLSTRAKQAICQSVASVIQAIPAEELQVAPLEQLLYFIEADIEQCLRMFSAGLYTVVAPNITATYPANISEMDWQAAYGLCINALRCLEGVAKGLQAPMDQPVDLEKETSTFWVDGKGSVTQQRIMSMMTRVYDVFRDQSEVVEVCCHVFRAGFVERSGGFAFPLEIIAQFLMRADIHTPRLGLIISTSCSLLSSTKSGPRADQVIDALVRWITHLLQTQGGKLFSPLKKSTADWCVDPGNDPEIAQNSIEFLSRLIPTYLNVLLRHQPPASAEFLFMFTLKALTGNDPLPKIAAADFWSNFLASSNTSSSEQDLIQSAIQHLGPLLAKALIYNIGGNASRSELDKLSEPLRKLVVSQAQSKSWLDAALRDDAFDGEKVAIKDRLLFLQKVMTYEVDVLTLWCSLRGARGTNTVVREFWIACRGTNFAYTS